MARSPAANNQSSPIRDAARNGKLGTLKALLKENPELCFSKDEQGLTPLHWAARRGRTDVLLALLAGKADVNARDNDGRTPLDWAEIGRHHDCIKALLATGEDSDWLDRLNGMGSKPSLSEIGPRSYALPDPISELKMEMEKKFERSRHAQLTTPIVNIPKP